MVRFGGQIGYGQDLAAAQPREHGRKRRGAHRSVRSRALDREAADAAAGARALIAVPLTRRGVLVGLVYAHAAEPRAWDAGEVDFVREVAGRISVALARIQATSASFTEAMSVALRSVCEAMAWAMVRVFFNRWLSSRLRKRCCSSAWMRASATETSPR
jgi:hypothetical protein